MSRNNHSHNQPSLYPNANYPRQPPPDGPTGDYPVSHPSRDMPCIDDHAVQQLRSTARPPGDLCDCLSSCRRPLGMRYFPDLRLLSERHNQRLPWGVIWLVREPCGIFCLLFTWFLLLFAEFVIAVVILPRSPSSYFAWIAGSMYHLFAFLAGISHVKSFATNPGVIPIGNATSEAVSYITELHGDTYPSIIRCPKCLCIKPPRTHHCRMCSRCVRKMDHHCPWINNCVGEGNQKYFILFTLYICLQSFFAIFMGIYFVIQCVHSDWELCYVDQNNWFAYDFSPFALCIFIFGLSIEALVFGIFTLVMCIDQVCSVAADQTGIENLTKTHGTNEHGSRWKNLTMGCGSPFSWRWFSPFSPPPPSTPVFPGLVNSDMMPMDSSSLTLTRIRFGDETINSTSSRRAVVSL